MTTDTPIRLDIERRPLRHSDLTLPRVALGCGNFGGVGSSPAFFGQGLDDSQAFELMDAAWTLGITHFDTADAYGGGRSELAIGKWMRARGARPTLTGKTFNAMTAGGDEGLAPARVRRQFESSLERLGVERIDLYLAHEFDPDTPLAETLEVFAAEQERGRIGAYGVSNFDADQLSDALELGSPSAIQNSYSLLDREPEQRLLDLCAARGVAFTVFSPLSGGWLTGKYRRGQAYPAGSRMTQRPEPYVGLESDRVFDALEGLEAIAKARGTSMASVAIAWLLADDRVAQVVIGPGRPEQLAPVGEALRRPLSDDEHAELERLFA